MRQRSACREEFAPSSNTPLPIHAVFHLCRRVLRSSRGHGILSFFTQGSLSSVVVSSCSLCGFVRTVAIDMLIID